MPDITRDELMHPPTGEPDDAEPLPAPPDWTPPDDAGDPEVAAIGRIWDELTGLDDDQAVERILVYLCDRCLGVSLRELLEAIDGG